MVGAPHLLEHRRAVLGRRLPSRRLAEYVAIKEVLAQWTPRTIEVSILATQAAANSLLAANTIGILPERVRQQAAVEPLDCVGTLINTLVALNTTLVRLEPAAVTLVRRLGSLSAALRALTDPVYLNQSIIGLDGAIGALPTLATYTAGVYVINAAITVMPSAAALTTSLLVPGCPAALVRSRVSYRPLPYVLSIMCGVDAVFRRSASSRSYTAATYSRRCKSQYYYKYASPQRTAQTKRRPNIG